MPEPISFSRVDPQSLSSAPDFLPVIYRSSHCTIESLSLLSKLAAADLRQPVLSISLIPSGIASRTLSSAPPEILRLSGTFA